VPSHCSQPANWSGELGCSHSPLISTQSNHQPASSAAVYHHLKSATNQHYTAALSQCYTTVNDQHPTAVIKQHLKAVISQHPTAGSSISEQPSIIILKQPSTSISKQPPKNIPQQPLISILQQPQWNAATAVSALQLLAIKQSVSNNSNPCTNEQETRNPLNRTHKPEDRQLIPCPHSPI